jgi:biotin carboxyl carrier protein
VTLQLHGSYRDSDADTRLLKVDPGRGVLRSDGRDVAAWAVRRTGAEVVLEVDGRTETGYVLVQAHCVLVSCHGQTYTFSRPDPFGPTGAPDPHDGSIIAPMPGTVLVLDVVRGAAVEEGETVAVLEAMKMELALKAPFAGTVVSVSADAGQQVELGAELLRVLRDPSELPDLEAPSEARR